jgi:hypothetical protein
MSGGIRSNLGRILGSGIKNDKAIMTEQIQIRELFAMQTAICIRTSIPMVKPDVNTLSRR